MPGSPPVHEAIEQFKGADVYVAHNCEFEQSFLGTHLGDVPWLCTYKCALRLWPDYPSHGNQALRYMLGLARPFSTPRKDIHPRRASSDVIVTAAILVVEVPYLSDAVAVVWFVRHYADKKELEARRKAAVQQ